MQHKNFIEPFYSTYLIRANVQIFSLKVLLLFLVLVMQLSDIRLRNFYPAILPHVIHCNKKQ